MFQYKKTTIGKAGLLTVLMIVFALPLFAQHMGGQQQMHQHMGQQMMNMQQMMSRMQDIMGKTNLMMNQMHDPKSSMMSGDHEMKMMHGKMNMTKMMSDDQVMVKMTHGVDGMAKQMNSMMKSMNEMMQDGMMKNPALQKQMSEMHKNMQKMMNSLDGVIDNLDQIKTDQSGR